MLRLHLLISTCFLLLHVTAFSQKVDSTADIILKMPLKFVDEVDSKVDLYTSRITGKTEKTLSKLCRWENRIKSLLEASSPETANRLFGNNQLTFTKLLQDYKQGEIVLQQYQAPYNKYHDDISTSLKYLENQKAELDEKVIKKVSTASKKMNELNTEEAKIEVVKLFIKERKKELISQSIKIIGNTKYLNKINKEAYYYVETLKNYKELFSDSKKAEETALLILNRIPAFQKFMQQNSMLASMFGPPGGPTGPGAAASIAGLQTRVSVQNLIQNSISAGGPSAQQIVSQNMQQAKVELTKLRDKILSSALGGKASGDGELPDFKPNMQKTKTFMQRLDYGLNFQFGKSNYIIPATSNIALTVGFKINDRSVIGIGASYFLGMGSIQHIQLTNEGIGLRSFIDWNVKKSIFISGGYEMNHNNRFDNFSQLGFYQAWQRSALLGVTKKISTKSKWFKSSNIQVLYDFLYREHIPVTQPVVFRFGYSIK